MSRFLFKFLILFYLVIGLIQVLLTFISISLSHISFIVQPAPLIIKAPAAKIPSNPGSGKGDPAGAARPRLHPQGQNNNHEPIGLSTRINFKYGCTLIGALSTNDDII